MDAGQAVLIYDGSCPVCRKTAGALGKRGFPGAFEFLPCDSAEVSRRYPQISRADCLRAVQLVLPDGTVLAGSAAAPEIAARIPRYRWIAPLLRLPAVAFVAEFAYRTFARNRNLIARTRGC